MFIGMGIRIGGNKAVLSDIAKAIAFLKSQGENAHVWLPGIGALNGIQAGNYLDSAGTTLAAIDGPGGRVNDGMGVLGVELVTNGDFSSPVGWTLPSSATISGGSLNFNSSTPEFATLPLMFVAGKTYVIEFDYTHISGGGFRGPYDGGAGNIISVTATGHYKKIMYSTSGNVLMYVGYGGTSTGSFDNISVREISGIHLTQATTASKPVLRRGLLNQALQSNAPTTSPWVFSPAANGCTKDQVGRDGSANSAWRITALTSSSAIYSFTTVVPGVYTFAFWAKSNGGTQNYIGLWDRYGVGSVSSSRDFTEELSTTEFRLITITHTVAAGGTTLYYYITRDKPAGSVDVIIQDVGLFQGTLTAADIIKQGGIPVTTTAPASNPNAGSYSWAFDGSNDSLQLSAVPFQMSDDHCVIAASENQKITGAPYIFGVKGDSYLCSGAIAYASGKPMAFWYDGTTTAAVVHGSVVTAPCVITASKVGANKTLRVNSVKSGATNTSVMASVATGSAYIGSSSGASAGTVENATYAFTGNLGPVIAIKGNVSDANLLLLEKLVANLSGVTLP